jgi:hypothetical protein
MAGSAIMRATSLLSQRAPGEMNADKTGLTAGSIGSDAYI